MSSPGLLIEKWLPTKELGIESRRENSTGQHPPINRLHVWWARRPLAASTGAVLGSLMPAWTEELATRFPDKPELATEADYRRWFLKLCGILGDPIAADLRTRAARESGQRIPNPYTYKQAYKNRPTTSDLQLLIEVLVSAWGRVPVVVDPTAGGGSIPYQAIRYGLPSHATDLNSIATAVLRAGIEIPAAFGSELAQDLSKWGTELCRRLKERLLAYFPDGPDGQVATFLFARTIACPRTGKLVPLSPNWWLSKEKGGTAVKLITDRKGVELVSPEFEIVKGKAINGRLADSGTISRGDAVSPWDGLVIDGEYIKAEAKAGQMGSLLYAVAVRTPRGRSFRTPTSTDLASIEAAEKELARKLPEWDADAAIPDEDIPFGNKTSEPIRYGMTAWREMFSPRQLLAHGTFVEEYRRLIPEVQADIADPERAEAVLALLALIQGKAINYNALLASWHVSRGVMRSVFERHDFAFAWTYAEFEGARELYQWGLEQVIDAYSSLAQLLPPDDTADMGQTTMAHPVPAPIQITRGNAGDMDWIEDDSVELVCIDPPYYDNVMYAELADFFYVWEKRTLGLIWPDLFRDELTNKDDEAVKNDSRFAHAGNQKKRLATLDYERKMTAIFSECRRVLRDDGVMTVMFFHKKAEAWDTLGQSVLEAGFTVEASWPVPTESEQSLHQAKKNAAASTIFLVCRKRPSRVGSERLYFNSIESEVRSAARTAYADLTQAGMNGVDRLLATYGPALSVLSEHWPVYSSQPDEATGQSRLLRPEEALIAAQQEVVALQRSRLVASQVEFDPLTDFWLMAWDTFEAREFPFDEARKMCLAVGGVDIDELVKAKVLGKKAGTVTITEPRG
ncbi:MAG TPA: DUF1156 domain-containing protein, partial [Acidimicrobiia bacterium]|nr:DUF1156 domain-containing protein [Acidimicrobiia bacterium]